MNRTTGLNRTTPLRRGESRLARVPLRRTADPPPTAQPLARRPPLRAVPSLPMPGGRTIERAGRGETFSAAACALIDLRDSDHDGALPVRLCQRCGTTRDLHRHHRRLKGDGGSDNRPHAHCPCNAVTLCAACHLEWAHRERTEAEAQGFIVSQAVAIPGSVSVMRFAEGPGGASQFPSCDGRWMSCPGLVA